METSDGRITVQFPASTVTNETEVIIGECPVSDAPSAFSGFKFGNTYFGIEGITTVAKEITVIVKYYDEDVQVAGGDPNLLILSRYDEGAGEWIVFAITVDTSDQTLTTATDRLSKWMVVVKEAPVGSAEELCSGLLPSIWVAVGVGGFA